MQKSFFVGLLASLALAGNKDSGTGYGVPSTSNTPIVTVQQINFPGVNVAGGSASSTTTQSVNIATSQALENASAALGTTINRSIDSLFLRLPSSAELDRLILAADSVALLKTIQTVATDDSLTCDQRIAYLLEVIGRIRTAVEKKQFAVDQLNIIVTGANNEIARLTAEVNRLEGQITNLWLDELESNLNDAVVKLEGYYRQFNAVEANIAPNEAKVAGYEKQISILISSSDAERNRIANDRLKLTEIQANIRDLQNKLGSAQSRENALLASIQRSQDVINNNNAKVADIRSKIKLLEDEVRKLRDEVDRLRAKYNDIEIQVERLRTDISVAQNKANRYRTQIRELETKIVIERQKIPRDDLDDLNDMIATLNRIIPNVQSEIDRHYYYCYGDGSVQVEETGGVVVYIVRGERFGDYLRKQYGDGATIPGLRSLGSVELRRVDIFSNVWSAAFGYPFTQSSFTGTNLDIAGSFNCLNPSSAQKGYGTITEIGADYIGVQTSSGRQRFNLGSCSRLESVSELPTIGQNIAYVGVPSSADGYNLYQASCW